MAAWRRISTRYIVRYKPNGQVVTAGCKPIWTTSTYTTQVKAEGFFNECIANGVGVRPIRKVQTLELVR